MCLLKHGGARDSKFMVTHPMADQSCLTSAITRRSALTAEPSSSSSLQLHWLSFFWRRGIHLPAEPIIGSKVVGVCGAPPEPGNATGNTPGNSSRRVQITVEAIMSGHHLHEATGETVVPAHSHVSKTGRTASIVW
jgi:hypothetical protein